MKNKTLITSLAIAVVVILFGVIVYGSRTKSTNLSKKQLSTQINDTNKKNNDSIVFFYGSTCPHCAEVETWMKENKVEEKITVIKKEVYGNQQNANEMVKAAQSCGLPTDSIGVPFLYTEGKCFIGTPDVISYLSKKAGIESTERSPQ